MAKPLEEARAKGDTRYFTDVACKRGHISERFTSNQCCVACVKENRRGKRTIEGRNYYAKHREKKLLWRHSWKLKSRYGITVEDHAAMMEKQGDKCAVCGTSERSERNGKRLRFCLDHDHATGRVRGFLCNACNVGLGHFRDDPSLLVAALRYLAPQLAAEVLRAYLEMQGVT
jgi:hypothetical protein